MAIHNNILIEVKEYSYLFISVPGLIGKCSALLKCQCHIRIFGETMNESILRIFLRSWSMILIWYAHLWLRDTSLTLIFPFSTIDFYQCHYELWSLHQLENWHTWNLEVGLSFLKGLQLLEYLPKSVIDKISIFQNVRTLSLFCCCGLRLVFGAVGWSCGGVGICGVLLWPGVSVLLVLLCPGPGR